MVRVLGSVGRSAIDKSREKHRARGRLRIRFASSTVHLAREEHPFFLKESWVGFFASVHR